MRTIYQQMLIALLALIPVGAWAQTTFTQGDFTYTVTDEENHKVSIAKAAEVSLTGALVIPSSVTHEAVTYSVTSVKESGFNGTGITSVTIPASVMTIGIAAFQSCGGLASITIEDSETPLTMSGAWYERPLWSPASTIYIGRDLTLTGEGVNPLTYDATTVEFGPKVTTINPALFYTNNKLASITIGSGVTTIGESAFYSCGQAEEVSETVVSMGSNVTSIGINAFHDCPKLKSIALPSTLTTIGNEAFRNTGLTSITIPASVMTIGNAVFQDCGSMTSITIEDSETPLTMPGSWYERPFWNTASTIYIGRNLTLTGEGVNPLLYNATSVEFGPKVTTINPALFYDNNNLASITIGSGVTTIGDNAFYSCGDAEEVSETVVSMGSNVTSIGINAFRDCPKLKSIALPSTLTTIGNEAFHNTGLTSISIPASVTSIGVAAFQYCGSMTSIRIEDSETPLTITKNWYDRPFLNPATTIYLGRDLTLTGEGNNPLLNGATSVEFGPQVTSINPYLFQGCVSLSNINMTNATSLTSIGAYAFDGAGNVDSVDELTVTLGSSLTTIGERAFNDCDKINTITIPASVTTIEASAFWNMNGDLNLTIEDSETPLTINAEDSYYPIFENKNITGYIGRNILRTGNYVNKSVFNTSSSYQHHLTFGPMVTAIGEKEYYDCDGLRTVSGMENVVSIGNRAFSSCGNLTSISLGTKLQTIGIAAFTECTALTAIELPATLKVLTNPSVDDRYGVFEGCSALATVTLPEGLEEIGHYAFYSCSALTSITIPSTVTTIGRAPFYGCDAMTDMVVADGDTPIQFNNAPGSPFNSGRYNLTPATVLTNFYLGRNINRQNKTEHSLVYDANNIEIGPKVTDIELFFTNTGDNSSYEKQVQTVKVHAVTPIAIQEEAFHNITFTNATLLVPGGTTAAYTADDNNWKKFTNIDYWSTLVTLTATAHGSIATAEATASNGTEQYRQPKTDAIVYTLTADEGYELTALTDNNEAVSPLPALGEAQTRTNASGEEFVTLNATFSAITYTLNYELAGGSVASANPTTYTIESAAITLNNPTREGYNFTGWKLNGEGEAMMEVIIAKGSTGDKSYTATWTPIIYNIALTLDGGTAENPTTYTIESEAITLTNPTKTGYTFKGWKLNGEGDAMMEVIIAKGSTGDKAYTATWQINQYTITFDTAGGSAIDPITQNYAATVEAPAAPTRTGYTFAGWEPEVPATIPAENMTCVAQWTINQYTITFNTAGGSVIDPITQDYATTVVAPANPTREGYTFAGWDSEIPTTIPAEDVTINATWTPVTYNISYELAGGAFAVQDAVVMNINATTGGWTASNDAGTWASKWESTSDNPHVKFFTSGNNMSFYDGTNIQCYNTYGGTTTNMNYTIQAPEGWYITRVSFDFVANSANGVAVTLNGNQSAQSLSTTDTKHLEATSICKNEVIMNVAMVNANKVFAQLSKFVVELTAHPTAYTIESGTFTIENPTKDGHDFAGWTGTGLEAATKDVTIATGSTGDRSYTATWTAAVYAVSITGSGVTADNMTPKYGDNVTITIAEDEDRELNTLTVNGVDVTASVVAGQYTIEEVTGNVVVVATFNSTKEFITLPASSDYATFSCSQDLDFAEVSGLKAYIASGFDKTTGTVLLTRVESVPAGTGLLLRGTAGETYKVPYAESASYYVNMLKPVLTATTIAQTEGDYTNYFLGKQGDPEVIGFYMGKVEGTAVSAQKAYLQLPTSAVDAGTKSIGIYFDDTTGVGEVKASTMAPEGVYDIHGRKIPAGQKLTRGIYIINGKKVSIK